MRTGRFKVIFAGKMASYTAFLPENSYKFQCYFINQNSYRTKTQLYYNSAQLAITIFHRLYELVECIGADRVTMIPRGHHPHTSYLILND